MGYIPAHRRLHAEVRGAFHEAFEKIAGPVRPSLIDDFVEGFHPFGGFLGIEVVGSLDFCFQHEGSLPRVPPKSRIRQANAGICPI